MRTSRANERSLESSLAVVDATPGEVVDLLRPISPNGTLHLVGSLGAGLGNRGSDIDVHLLEDEITSEMPMMFFLRRTIVDFTFIHRSAPARALDELPQGRVDLPIGAVAIGVVPVPAQCSLLSRWACSLPFGGADPLFDDVACEVLVPTLVRAAVERALVAASSALAFDASKRPAGMLWRRAASQLLSAWCAGQGELFVGDKWVWSKAERAGASPELIEAVEAARSATALTALFERWLPGIPVGSSVVVEPRRPPEVVVGGSRFAIIEKTRAVDITGFEPWPTMPLLAAIDEHGPAMVSELIAERLVGLSIDAGTLEAQLT